MPRNAFVLASLFSASVASAALAAEPVRIGITTILSGPMADRGQSEQYGAQLALNQINEVGRGARAGRSRRSTRTTPASPISACRRRSG